MNTYRSLNTIEAVQYQGTPIEGVTCHGSDKEVQANGCDSSRKQHTHVHANVTGGMIVLKPGDWVFPVQGGPWGVASDARFRASWEVPALAPSPAPEVAAPAATFSVGTTAVDTMATPAFTITMPTLVPVVPVVPITVTNGHSSSLFETVTATAGPEPTSATATAGPEPPAVTADTETVVETATATVTDTPAAPGTTGATSTE